MNAVDSQNRIKTRLSVKVFYSCRELNYEVQLTEAGETIFK